MGLQKQFFGIKYPFTHEDDTKYFLDLNSTLKEKARSVIMHALFTPKGQKLRDYEFGTNLVKYIFEPNDNVQWSVVKDEISGCIKRYMPNVDITNIEVLKNEDDMNEVYVKVAYTVTNGKISVSDSIGLRM